MQSKENILQKPWVVVCLASFACFLWGSAFPMVKTGYAQFGIQSGDYASQILFAGCRFTLSGFLTWIVGSIAQKKPLLPKKQSLGAILKLGFFQTFLQYVFFYIGLANTTGVKSSIIGGSSVFITLLMGWVLLKQQTMTKNKLFGCVLGFVGLVLINLQGETTMDFQFSLVGEGFIFISTFFSSIAAVLLKKYGQNENPVVLAGFQLGVGGLALIVVGWLSGGHLQANTPLAYGTYAYLAFLSAAAFTIWGLLLKWNDLATVSVYKFSTPLFGTLLSFLVLQETGHLFTPTALLALALVCFGIFIVNKK